MTSPRPIARYWIGGIALATIGVLVTRWSAGHLLGAAHLQWSSIGRLIAIAGLAVIAFGISRRVRSSSSSTQISS